MSSDLNTDAENLLSYHDKLNTDSDLTATEIFQNVGDFASNEIRPLDDIIDEQTHHFPYELWKKLGDQGYKGIIIPQEFGGLGLGYLHLAAATFQISRASGSIGLSYIADQALCAHQILKHGTQKQKEKFLPKLASGEFAGALAMSEPESGSDVMSMKTRATKDKRGGKKGYVLNGGKCWITNGGKLIDPDIGKLTTADILVVYAVTSDSPKRLTAFTVEGGTKGFKAVRKEDKEGLRGSDTVELQFDDCFIPEENVLGQVDKGAHVLMEGLNAERLILAAGALGLAMAACEEGIEYTTERKQFNTPISYNQSVANDLSDIYSSILGALANIFNAAGMADQDKNTLTNTMAASVFLEASKIATHVTEQNVYYHGGNGQTTDYRAGRLKRDASLYRVGGGSEAMRHLRIAEQIIPGYREHLQAGRKIKQAFNKFHKISEDGLRALKQTDPDLADKLNSTKTPVVIKGPK